MNGLHPRESIAAIAAVIGIASCSPPAGEYAPADLTAFATDYAAAWSSQDPARLAAHYTEDGSLTVNDGEPSVGRQAIENTARSFMTAYPDMVVVLDSLGRAGDRTTFHWTWTGTNTGPGGTGKAVKISGFEEWMFGPDGLIVDSRGHYDEAEYERQLAGGGPLPQWDYDPGMVFPADRSLQRPEDGLALSDGSLIVIDQAHGLRKIAPDGSHAPFGDMLAAGYIHRPPEHAGGANGISLEPDGVHALVADIFQGVIFRVNLQTGDAELIYRHPYGINTAVRDSRGAVWFTQSAHNTPEAGEARMWATIDIPVPEGALYRLGTDGGALADAAELVLDSLYFANGLAIDEANGHLFLSETMAGRVLRYDVDVDAGSIDARTVLVDGMVPDNVELDGEGYLWVALPLTNEVIVIDPATGARHSAFRSLTPAQQEVNDEFIRRGQAGISRLELFGPESWAPLPGSVTGVILGEPTDPVYITNLGDALVRLDR